LEPSCRKAAAAYTWAENAHEFRLTPWENDPVSDGCGEALYLRDEDSGQFWSPTPLPCPGSPDHPRWPDTALAIAFSSTARRHSQRAVDLRGRECTGEVLGAQAAQ